MNKLMLLLRREGRAEFGVYIFKLRGKTPGNNEQFSQALDILLEKSIIEKRRGGNLVVLTGNASEKMYDPRLIGHEGFDSKESFWSPIVKALDSVLN